jgi:hypothetical protein
MTDNITQDEQNEADRVNALRRGAGLFELSAGEVAAMRRYREAEQDAKPSADEMAAEAERAARTMAPPVPGVTRNAGHVIRAVITASGRDTAWFVAAEDPERGQWVTWRAEMFRSGERAGQLACSAGNYFRTPDARQRALADLAVRAGVMPGIGLRIADDILCRPGTALRPVPAEDKRMARRLRAYFSS